VAPASGQTWTADNGNGTFSNPLFFDEFSDPDLIRVGDDFYLTGTTMHSMPGLPILHSRDLVNCRFLGYALDRLDLGPEFRLEDGRAAHGQGIWAPSLRHHNGTFYVFSNVNNHSYTLTLGDTTMQIVATPGHTSGTLSYVFPVKDQGRTVMVAYSGGTLTGAFGTDAARWDEYIASQRKIAKAASDAGASVILSNHSEYEGPTRRRA